MKKFNFLFFKMQLNTIYNEDCLLTMAKMPDNFIDLTVTSPPYDNLRQYKGYSFEFEKIAKELFRTTKEGGVVVWIVNDATINGSETGTSFRQALFFKEVGFNLHDTMIYNRTAAFPSTTRYYQDFEFMFVFSKGIPKTTNLLMQNKTIGTLLRQKNKSGIGGQRQQNGELDRTKWNDIFLRKEKARENEKRIMSNVWEISRGNEHSTSDDIAFKHPAIFPEELAEKHIWTWSNEGDLVYDCFGGSGTTAKMAHKLKRNWILSEISEEYVKIAEKRIAPYLAQTSLF